MGPPGTPYELGFYEVGSTHPRLARARFFELWLTNSNRLPVLDQNPVR